MRSTGETHYHGVVVLLYSTKGDIEETLRLERNIIFRVWCGIAILVRIDTEDGEVASMTRPDPVVRIGTEFAYAAGRCSHQSNIRISLFGKHQVEIAPVEGFDLYGKSRILGRKVLAGLLVSQLLQVLRREVVHAVGIFDGFEFFLDVVCDIFDLVDEYHGNILVR